MAKGESKGRNKDSPLFQRLFGDLTDLSDEEVDLLWDAFSTGEERAQAVYRIAEEAAVEYRKMNVPLPDHVKAAIQATRPLSNLEGATAGMVQKLVEKLKKIVAGPVNDPAFAYHKRTELNESDRAILDELTNELQKDWSKEEPK